MIGSLQSLRFVFCIMIFLHHYTVDGESLFYAGGVCGVSFFMILSGFVMSAGYSEKVACPSFTRTRFFIKRLIRLYPLHLLCLLGFLFLHFSTLSVMGYLKLIPNVLLLQSWIPVKGVYFSGNAVSWCLSDMLFFYAMFPVLSRGLNRLEHKKIYWRGISLLLLYCSIMLWLPEAYCHQLLYISPAFRLIDFLIGMLVYKVYNEWKTKGYDRRMNAWSYAQKSFIELFLVMFLTSIIMLVPQLDLRYYCAALWWFVMPGMILYFALINKSGGGNFFYSVD